MSAATMEHRVDECVKEPSHTELTIKTEVEEATPSTVHVEIEIDITEDAGLVQLVRREPGLSVKDIVEDDWQDSSSSKQLDDSIEKRKHQCYKCDICLNVYKSKDILKIHSKRKHGTESHKCAQCNKEFKCKEYLSEHVKYTHRKEQYECYICKKMYKSRAALRYHISSFHRNRSADSSLQRDYTCSKCLTVFKSDVCRIQHIKQVHGIQSHKCTQCDKEFKRKQYLSRHVQYTHCREQYNCDICKKMCKSRRVLLQHFSRYHRNRSAVFDKQQGNEATSTSSIVSSANVAACNADRYVEITIKQEPRDTDLDIGPAVLQHVDSHRRPFQVKADLVKMESSPLTDKQTVKNEPDLSMKEDIADPHCK